MILYYWFQVLKTFNDSLTQMQRQEMLPSLIERINKATIMAKYENDTRLESGKHFRILFI